MWMVGFTCAVSRRAARSLHFSMKDARAKDRML